MGDCFLTAFLLTACGGAGGSGSESSPTTTNPLAQYVGTWSSLCSTGTVQNSERSRTTLTLSTTEDNTINGVSSTLYYNGQNCSGTPVTEWTYPPSKLKQDFTAIENGESVSYLVSSRLAGSVTFTGASEIIDLGGGVKTIKVTFSSGSMSMNFELPAQTNKLALKLDAAGTTMSSAEGAADAKGYPSFSKVLMYTKQ